MADQPSDSPASRPELSETTPLLRPANATADSDRPAAESRTAAPGATSRTPALYVLTVSSLSAAVLATAVGLGAATAFTLARVYTWGFYLYWQVHEAAVWIFFLVWPTSTTPPLPCAGR